MSIGNSGFGTIVQGLSGGGMTGPITASQIATGTITAVQIATGTITSTQLASSSVTSTQIAVGAVGPTQLASNSVTSSAIASGAIGPSQLASNSVTSSAIATSAVTSSQLAANAVTSTAIASGAIGPNQLAANAVTTSAVATGTITGSRVGNLQVANLAALALLTDIGDGQKVYVKTLRDTFVYNSTASTGYTADAITTIAGPGGVGFWTRQLTKDPTWAQQAVWALNGTSGSDENTGLDSTHAIKTFSELRRRIDGSVLSQSVVCTWYDTNDVTENINLNIIFADNEAVNPLQFAIVSDTSTWTTVYSGTLGAGTLPLAQASQQPNTLVDTSGGFDWNTSGTGGTSLVGWRVRMTSGAANNYTSWIDKRVSATTATAKAFTLNTPLTTPIAAGTSQGNPASGDTYVIERLPGCRGINVNVSRLGAGSSQAGFIAFIFDSFELGKTSASSYGSGVRMIGSTGAMQLVLSRCWNKYVSNSAQGSEATVEFANVHIVPETTRSVSYRNITIIAGGVTGAFGAAIINNMQGTGSIADPIFRGLSSAVVLAGNFVFQGAAFDSTSDGFTIRNANASGHIFNTASRIWGNNNTGVGLDIQSAASIEYDTNQPIVTGTAGDTRIANVVVPYTQHPFFDVTNQSGILFKSAPMFANLYLTAQGAAIGATNLFAANPTKGLYALDIYLAVTTVGSAGDTATVTIAYTDDAQAESVTPISSASVAAKGQFNSRILVETTGAANVTYALAFPVKTGTPQVSLRIKATRLG